MFYFTTVPLFYICVLEVVTTVATSPYLIFIALLCQVKSLIEGRYQIWITAQKQIFLLTRIWVEFSVDKSENYANLRA